MNCVPNNLGLTFLSEILPEHPKRYLAIGGLPRSGTTSCDRWLHSFPSCFIADEFHGLTAPDYSAALRFLQDYAHHEVEVWTDSAGRSWREATLNDLDWRRHRALLSTLFLYTRSLKFLGKKPKEIDTIGFKLPMLETVFSGLLPCLLQNETFFVYCVREPIDILKSNWTMPWTKETDQERFVDWFISEIARSMAGIKKIQAAGCPVLFWSTPAHDTGAEAFIQKLGIFAHSANRETPRNHFDEWPPERRRKTPPLSNALINYFSLHPTIEKYRLLGSAEMA
jgi:hypothetical protein